KMSAIRSLRSLLAFSHKIHLFRAFHASKARFSLNVDYQNLSKFYAFDNWWTDERLKPLRAMNELRIPLIVNQLLNDKTINSHKPLSGFTLLDVGSGGGFVSEPLARLGASVTGIDANAQCVEFTNSRLRDRCTQLKSNLNYVHTTVEQFLSNETREKFDAVIASEVLEHIDDVESFIQSCHSLLKSNGHLFITTINQTLAAYLLAIVAAEKLLGLVPDGIHEYNKLVPLLGLKVMLEKNDFRPKLIHGMCFNPITQRWSWTWNTSVNYAIVAVKSLKVKTST
ncbi:ubiquinone biosynthesis O-methyltransferase-like protein, partial [Dinothrombium tinctorium]